jgi:hypothetical protein
MANDRNLNNCINISWEQTFKSYFNVASTVEEDYWYNFVKQYYRRLWRWKNDNNNCYYSYYYSYYDFE